jgi:uncharacterized tellurite resistance protein B-like protein
MFDLLKKIFIGDSPSQTSDPSTKNYLDKKKLQIATCAIFLEMAKSDENYTEEEHREVVSIMQRTFNLEKEYVDELIELANSRLAKSVSIYEFTGIINENFSAEGKFELMKNLWRLIYTDKKLDKYEDQLVKTIGSMLLLEHRDVIAAKLMVKEELK